MPAANRCDAVAAANDVDGQVEQSNVVPLQTRSSSRSNAGRARDESVTKSAWPASEEAADFALNVDGAVGAEPAAPPSAVSLSELRQRAELMFRVDAKGPAASGRPTAAQFVTKELVQLAWWAANELCDANGSELSAAYGNFDRVVALGWLLGDVACGRLITGDAAFKVGRKAGKLAPGLQAQFDAPSRRVGKRKWDSDEALQAAQDAAAEEETNVRCAPVDLPFADMPPPPPRALPAPPASSPAPPPPRAACVPRQRVEPTAPSDERLKLLKALRAAEGAVAEAEGGVAAANRERDKAKVAWEHALQEHQNPHRAAQISDDRWDEWREECLDALEVVRQRYSAAMRALGDPEEALHRAKFELKEARAHRPRPVRV